jgi:hypothetical protein
MTFIKMTKYLYIFIRNKHFFIWRSKCETVMGSSHSYLELADLPGVARASYPQNFENLLLFLKV